MKILLIKLGILVVLIFFFVTERNVLASLPLEKKTIILDSGHGGLDPGTMYKDIYEKDINLAISFALKDELEKMGAKVILTRKGDYDLAKPNASRRKKSDFDNRIRIINNSNANYYISIHLNYLPNSIYYGPQVFYNFETDNNKKMAMVIQNDLNKELKTSRDAKKIPSSTYMYSRLNVTGVLIECGFLSNQYERNLLVTDEYQKKLASIIANSLTKLEF